MPDAWFDHHQGLITKSEVRAVTLAKLRLEAGQVLWDSAPAAARSPSNRRCSLEEARSWRLKRSPESRTGQSQRQGGLGVRNLKIVQTELPEGLEGLPKPDRIFIGGGGRELGRIITEAADICGRAAASSSTPSCCRA